MDPALIEKFKTELYISDTKEVKSFLFCIFKELNYLEKNGEIKYEFMSSELRDEQEKKVVFDFCSKQEKTEDKIENVYKLMKCVIEQHMKRASQSNAV